MSGKNQTSVLRQVNDLIAASVKLFVGLINVPAGVLMDIKGVQPPYRWLLGGPVNSA